MGHAFYLTFNQTQTFSSRAELNQVLHQYKLYKNWHVNFILGFVVSLIFFLFFFILECNFCEFSIVHDYILRRT